MVACGSERKRRLRERDESERKRMKERDKGKEKRKKGRKWRLGKAPEREMKGERGLGCTISLMVHHGPSFIFFLFFIFFTGYYKDILFQKP